MLRYRTLYFPLFVFYIEWKSVRLELLTSIVDSSESEFGVFFWHSFIIGVLRHMERYFSYIFDGTDVQADWRSCTYGRAPNAIDIPQGSLTCPVLHRHKTNLFIRGFWQTAPWVAFYDTLGIRRTYSRLNPPASSSPGILMGGGGGGGGWYYFIEIACRY